MQTRLYWPRLIGFNLWKMFTRFLQALLESLKIFLLILCLGCQALMQKIGIIFVREVVTWPITHISLYCLMVHEHTPLYYNVERGEIKLPDDELIADLYCWSIEFLAMHGFMQYEVSNFARQGYESQHNTVYWDRKPYKGFGLGACSFDGSRRFMNEQNLMHYITDVNREELQMLLQSN